MTTCKFGTMAAVTVHRFADARLTLRLLAKNPAERPQDARAVVEEIDAYTRILTRDQQALLAAALELDLARSNPT
jgi:hypothetical protein